MDVLARFAAEHGIDFPLLSDEGSLTIRRLGLLNERVTEDHAFYGIAANPRHAGLPYPGVFALDEAGVVTRKRFHESYRERDVGAGLLARMLGLLVAGGPEAVGGSDPVTVRASLDSPTYAMFQRLHLTVEVRIAPGSSVLAAPAQPGHTPLAVRVAPVPGLEAGEPRWPVPRHLTTGSPGQRFPVHEGIVTTSIPLTFTAAPGGGDRTLQVTVEYQACTEAACQPPVSLTLTLPVREVPLVGRTLPGR